MFSLNLLTCKNYFLFCKRINLIKNVFQLKKKHFFYLFLTFCSADLDKILNFKSRKAQIKTKTLTIQKIIGLACLEP